MNSFKVFTLLVLATITHTNQEEVTYEKCSARYDLSMCNSANTVRIPCSKAKVCQKLFNVTSIYKEPYNFWTVVTLLSSCCGDCVNITQINKFNKVSELTYSVMNTSHFVYPVLARAAAHRLYDYYFIPVVTPPSIYFVTERDDQILLHLINACLDMWPLLVVVTLMIAIAGFVGWLLETWGNEGEFPRPFLKGWFEGFWWGFILITTVGYGDKVTKSVPAKCFSVVWIIIGITMFSMITAMLTSVVGEFNTPAPPDVSGMKVGALRHRTYESTIIAKSGGILVDVNHEDVYKGINDLIVLLRKKEIDGFVLDRNTFLMFLYNKSYKDSVKYLLTKTLQTEKYYQGEKLSYGMLVKDYGDFMYLNDYILDNLDVINTCNGLVINMYAGKVNTESENLLFSSSGDYFWPSCTTLSIVIGLIMVFGVIYEYYRRGHSTDSCDV